MLESNPHELGHDDGNVSGNGSPDRSPSFGDIATYVGSGVNLPGGEEPIRDERACDNPPKWTFPFGTHSSVVEGTPVTSQVALKRSVAVDDVGTIIYP